MRAFTLVELIVVAIILGLLAVIGLPAYRISKERALGREGSSSLKLLSTAEKTYRMEYGTYYPSSGSTSDMAAINTNLKLVLQTGATRNWDYSITGGANSFTAYADRVGSGGFLDCQYSINNTQDEPVANPSCP